jgi:hypothetical protein
MQQRNSEDFFIQKKYIEFSKDQIKIPTFSKIQTFPSKSLYYHQHFLPLEPRIITKEEISKRSNKKCSLAFTRMTPPIQQMMLCGKCQQTRGERHPPKGNISGFADCSFVD